MSLKEQVLVEKEVKFKLIEYKPEEQVMCSKEEIDQLHKDVIQLNEITLDMCNLIVSQNEQIDKIGDNTEDTLTTMAKAQTELNTALQYQKSNRSRVVAITVISACAGVALFSGTGAFLGLSKAMTLTLGAVAGGSVPHLF